MSVLALARQKMGSIVVDLGGGQGGVDYSTDNDADKKAVRVDAVWRIHLIPILMVLVFVILWAGSTEILPEEGIPGGFVTRMATATSKSVPSAQQLKVVNDEGSQLGVLKRDHALPRLKGLTSQDLSTNGLAMKEHMRGATR